jgi:hypothetical protein
MARRTAFILVETVASETIRPLPDCFDEVVVADHAVTMSNQVLQHVENLRLNRDKVAAAAQFASISIEAESVECVDQLVARLSVSLSIRSQKQGIPKGKLRLSERPLVFQRL